MDLALGSSARRDGLFKNPFAKDDDSNTDDDTKTGIDGSMDDSDSK